MLEFREYVDELGRNRYGRWLESLDDQAAAKVTIALSRMAYGNTSNLKSVGSGVSELKIDFGPGLRVYYGMAGTQLVLLLGGGTKRRQQQDIEMAKAAWMSYKRRKANGDR